MADFSAYLILILKGALVTAQQTFQEQVVRALTGTTLIPLLAILLLFFARASLIASGVRRAERRITRSLGWVR